MNKPNEPNEPKEDSLLIILLLTFVAGIIVGMVAITTPPGF